jgi:hypothetical protein
LAFVILLSSTGPGAGGVSLPLKCGQRPFWRYNEGGILRLLLYRELLRRFRFYKRKRNRE